MIEVRDLSKHYGAVRAVDGLSFQVRPGRVTGFLGPNGAGKSTTMRMIMGLDRPTSGTATVNGRRLAELRRPLFHVGAVLEVRATHGGRTARDHLRCLAAANGIGPRRVDEVLDLVGLTPAADRRARALSLGMSQRLGLGAALLGDPPVLLCDEPVNGLDPEGIVWVRTLLRALAAEGRTVFVSSHLMSEMALTADHVVVIGQGRLLADASVTEVLARGAATEVLVRTPRSVDLAAVLQAHGGAVSVGDASPDRLTVTGMPAAEIGDLAAAHGVPLHELTPRHASLEDVFMQLTADAVEFSAGATR